MQEISKLPLEELRKKWAAAWGKEPHPRIGRSMLTRSLQFKLREQEVGGPDPELQKRLKQLVVSYRRNPRCFDEYNVSIKPGARIVKVWKEKRHSVLVVENGFEYQDKVYTSLSEVAYAITGTRWNGWVFFGLKKKKEA